MESRPRVGDRYRDRRGAGDPYSLRSDMGTLDALWLTAVQQALSDLLDSGNQVGTVLTQRKELVMTGSIARRVRASLVASLTLVVVLLLGTLSAEAVTRTQKGSPGGQEIPTAWGVTTSDVFAPYVFQHAFDVYRSPSYSNYAQTICVTQRWWQKDLTSPYNPAYFYTSRTKCFTAQPGQYVVIPQWAVGAHIGYGYSADMKVTWKLSNGYVIGSRYVDYDQTGTVDYGCVDNFTPRTCREGYDQSNNVGWVGFKF